MENLSRKQRLFVKAYRLGTKAVPAILEEIATSPHRLQRWMKKKDFRTEIDKASKSLKLMGVWELLRISLSALSASERLLDGKEGAAPLGLTAQFIRSLYTELRDNRTRRGALPEVPMLLHPGSNPKPEEMLKALREARGLPAEEETSK